jgi:hypothetical protein
MNRARVATRAAGNSGLTHWKLLLPNYAIVQNDRRCSRIEHEWERRELAKLNGKHNHVALADRSESLKGIITFPVLRSRNS